MNQTTRPSKAAIAAVAALGALSLFGGWIVVYGRGFYADLGKRGKHMVFVDGAPAVLMAVLQLLCAALAFAWLLERCMSTRAAVGLACVGVFMPPAIYLYLAAG